ncbi:uncharacterized protein YbbC (DUF1343 family) [Chitinophaga skermanii]|uniref:Uncharacterized protein YbbC (DUF1343 family) n=1 Tax=Chitinophaga skermanii TaxID=331697 RepID=A0A327Q755_9BACT|nr:DUF1343 domain-containing protein [Chitinophaga skermanii]RAJ00319.1 uncharacterized protein YbbC (DUF1343 family) [Chitinophaga skermanii]
MKKLIVLLVLMSHIMIAQAQPRGKRREVQVGAARLQAYLPLLKGKRVALLVNYTATVGETHLVDTLLKRGVNIKKIFSPEHGFRGTADAGEKVDNTKDAATGLPIVSLYGKHRKADANDLKDVDIIIFDIQDVGVRFFTYISSLQELMESAAQYKKQVIVLDRPNPNGMIIDGPILDTAFRSFIGMQPIPVSHGMTVGEYARMLNGEKMLAKKAKCKLTVIPMQYYSHDYPYYLPLKPSPNLPNQRSVELYASICFFEGTVFSLGRGTDKPFQVFGHPALPKNLFSFTPRSVPGAKNPPLLDQTCYGFDLSADTLDIRKELNGKLRLEWLITAYKMYPEKDKFFIPFFSKLAGNNILQQQIEKGMTEDEIRATWEPGLKKFKAIRKKYVLYADNILPAGAI